MTLAFCRFQQIPEDTSFTTAEDEPCYLSEDGEVRLLSSLVCSSAETKNLAHRPARLDETHLNTAVPRSVLWRIAELISVRVCERRTGPRETHLNSITVAPLKVKIVQGSHVRLRILGIRGSKDGLVRLCPGRHLF